MANSVWSFSWDMDAFTNVASIVQAVVLTYTGTGARRRM
jgi:hypothetical protein